MRPTQRVICQRVIECAGVEAHQRESPPTVVRVAATARSRRRGLITAVEADVAGNVCADTAMARHAQAILRCAVERFVTSRAPALEVCVRLRKRTRRNETLDYRLGVREGREQKCSDAAD